jgi:hypothetical protein
MQGEWRLAIGERKGVIGSKRYEQVHKYGFSPKNMTNLFRLAYTGATFFRTERYPVEMKGEPVFHFLMEMKTEPQNFSLETLKTKYERAEKLLIESYEKRPKTFYFQEDIANELLLEIYLPILTHALIEKK